MPTTSCRKESEASHSLSAGASPAGQGRLQGRYEQATAAGRGGVFLCFKCRHRDKQGGWSHHKAAWRAAEAKGKANGDGTGKAEPGVYVPSMIAALLSARRDTTGGSTSSTGSWATSASAASQERLRRDSGWRSSCGTAQQGGRELVGQRGCCVGDPSVGGRWVGLCALRGCRRHAPCTMHAEWPATHLCTAVAVAVAAAGKQDKRHLRAQSDRRRQVPSHTTLGTATLISRMPAPARKEQSRGGFSCQVCKRQASGFARGAAGGGEANRATSCQRVE